MPCSRGNAPVSNVACAEQVTAGKTVPIGRAKPSAATRKMFGVFAPSAVPAAIVTKLNADITAIVQAPDMQKKLRELGAEPEASSVDAYAKYTRDEAGKWAAVVKRAGLAP